MSVVAEGDGTRGEPGSAIRQAAVPVTAGGGILAIAAAFYSYIDAEFESLANEQRAIRAQISSADKDARDARDALRMELTTFKASQALWARDMGHRLDRHESGGVHPGAVTDERLRVLFLQLERMNSELNLKAPDVR